MRELTIGFVGLGATGWPMAANLHAAGFALVVRDIDAATEARFAAEHPGAIAASTPPTSRWPIRPGGARTLDHFLPREIFRPG
jgi:UDP-N-acetylmuramoylalanine-D-glutamate ligase